MNCKYLVNDYKIEFKTNLIEFEILVYYKDNLIKSRICIKEKKEAFKEFIKQIEFINLRF